MGEIFLKLLNRSITAGWLILAVLCVRLVFRKIPKWVNCLLWGLVAIRLVFPFSIESAFSLQPSAQPIKSSTVVDGEVLPYVPSVDSNLSIVENTVNPILAENFAYQESESAAPLQAIMEAAGFVWIFGMILLLVFAIVTMIRLHFLVRESVCHKDNVYICDAVKSPFILGIIRPVIYLSSSLGGDLALNEEETEYIIAHEKAHLKRKDHLWKPFGYLLLSVYWFNPLCWIAYIMLCRDIELACDEKVIRDMSFADKKEYSRVLLSCATQRRLIMACPLAFGEVGVKERVKSVLHYKKPAFWITIAAIAACIVIAICFLTNPAEEYQIRITIPAGSTQEFCYSDEEISPKGDTLVISAGEGLGDCEVVLDTVEVREENTYEPTYLTPGMPVEMKAEKGAWFKIGVSVQNPGEEDIHVYVNVKNVEVRTVSAKSEEVNDNTENLQTSEPVQTEKPDMEYMDYQSIEDEVYRNLILEMMETDTFPATEGVPCDGMPYDNQYSVMDIDDDGKEELLINYANTRTMAGMVVYIYDYDRETKEIHIEFVGWPDMTVYDNGYIKDEASHNHGKSNLDNFWPYTLFKYNVQEDKYECVANVDAWQYQISEYVAPDPEFPKEKDVDGDGIVYYNHKESDHIMDNAEYEAWCQQYNEGKEKDIIWYPIISEEKYHEMFQGEASQE